MQPEFDTSILYDGATQNWSVVVDRAQDPDENFVSRLRDILGDHVSRILFLDRACDDFNGETVLLWLKEANVRDEEVLFECADIEDGLKIQALRDQIHCDSKVRT